MQKAKDRQKQEEKGNSQRKIAKEQFSVSGLPVNKTTIEARPPRRLIGHPKVVYVERHRCTMNVNEMLLGINTMIPIGLTSGLGQIVVGNSTINKAWDQHTMLRQSPTQIVARDIVASHLRDHIGECRHPTFKILSCLKQNHLGDHYHLHLHLRVRVVVGIRSLTVMLTVSRERT